MWVVLSAILAVSASAKVILGGFQEYLASTAMFSPKTIALVSSVTVLVEMVVAGLLIWPRCRRAGYIAAAGLFATFTVFHIAAAVLGDIKPCRCLVVELVHDRLWAHVLMTTLCIAATAGSCLAAAKTVPPITRLKEVLQ